MTLIVILKYVLYDTECNTKVGSEWHWIYYKNRFWITLIVLLNWVLNDTENNTKVRSEWHWI